MGRVSALILAAGRATRFAAGASDGDAKSKLLAEIDGRPMVRHVAETALASRAEEVVVVCGHQEAEVRDALAGLKVRLTANPDFATGMASSLRVGLAACRPDASGIVVLLGDMPRITPAIVDGLIACYERDGAGADAVVPTFEGRQGNPVLLGRSIFPAIGALEGDQGARRLFASPERRILTWPVDDASIEIDVDTREALARLQNVPKRN